MANRPNRPNRMRRAEGRQANGDKPLSEDGQGIAGSAVYTPVEEATWVAQCDAKSAEISTQDIDMFAGGA